MKDDELIQRYVGGDPAAFERLMQRHAGLVYSAALRQLGDRHEAEDLTQAVFFTLARKARSLEGRVLTAWLLRAVRLGALHQLRSRRRRAFHERKAAAMQANVYLAGAVKDYERMGPMLDEAIAALPEADRVAVVLKYHERLSVHEIAEMTGSTSAGVAKRLERAVEKLRLRFAQQEIRLTAGVVGGGLYYHLGQGAPAEVVGRLQGAWASAQSASSALGGPMVDGLARRLQVEAARLLLVKGALVVAVVVLGLVACLGVWQTGRQVLSPQQVVSTGR